MLRTDIQKHRVCGSCSHCCTVMGVEEIRKDWRCACVHLNGATHKQCGIYETRPLSCAQFNCLWRYGLGRHEDRPDQSRVIFAAQAHEGFAWLVAYIVDEMRPTARAIELIREVAAEVATVMVRGSETTRERVVILLGPEHRTMAATVIGTMQDFYRQSFAWEQEARALSQAVDDAACTGRP